MEQQDINILVNWRDKEINLKVAQNANVEELGQKLQELTNVKPDTMRLFVPNSNNKGVKMLSPFSDAYSGLSLEEAAIPEGKAIKMMGVSTDEIEEVSKKQDLRILGFDEEEKRLKQRAMRIPQTSLKLPQGQYIFCEFRPLQIPGIVLNPPPSEALRRMHMLACDPGIIAIMSKHRWRVGIMTEMAPEGYVGISPKCILGFNKNHGEEISLRLRTDDLRGFRKYDSIKKTLLHELAHMVFSEHDSNFFALNKQLNEEAENLDWTKSRSHTLIGSKFSNYYEEDDYIGESSNSNSQRLGGRLDPFATPRTSSVTAAYSRLVNASSNSLQASQGDVQPILQKDGFAAREHSADDIEMRTGVRSIAEPDPDDSHDSQATSSPLPHNEPNPDDDTIGEAMEFITELDSRLKEVKLRNGNAAEPDPDESVIKAIKDLVMEDLHLGKNYEPDPDDPSKDVFLQATDQRIEEPSLTDVLSDCLNNPELQRIEEPTAIICSRLQKAIDMLKSEVAPSQMSTALQTLFKIIRNVIEHPEEAKFRKLRKANPQFQKNVAKYKAAMEVLSTVGFSEDVILDEVGRAETFLVLKRNDPGLLWLAKSTLEISIAHVLQSA